MVFQSKGLIEMGVLSDLAKAKRVHLLGLVPLISSAVSFQMYACRSILGYTDGGLSNLLMKG